MTIKLTHEQAYILGSIAKHADHYRRNLKSLSTYVQEAEKATTPRAIPMDYATKARFAFDVIEELLDQCDEMFAHLDPQEQSRIVTLAMTPADDRGNRRRFNVDTEV